MKLFEGEIKKFTKQREIMSTSKTSISKLLSFIRFQCDLFNNVDIRTRNSDMLQAFFILYNFTPLLFFIFLQNYILTNSHRLPILLPRDMWYIDIVNDNYPTYSSQNYSNSILSI